MEVRSKVLADDAGGWGLRNLHGQTYIEISLTIRNAHKSDHRGFQPDARGFQPDPRGSQPDHA